MRGKAVVPPQYSVLGQGLMVACTMALEYLLFSECTNNPNGKCSLNRFMLDLKNKKKELSTRKLASVDMSEYLSSSASPSGRLLVLRTTSLEKR